MSNEHDSAEVRKAVVEWKHHRNQRHMVLKSMVAKKIDWTTGAALRTFLPTIKDLATVLYDMAMRNPTDTPRGQGYYDRFKVYPRGYAAKPILEYDETLGYRIRPEYLEVVSKTV